MELRAAIEINAPAERVFACWTDVERWPEWTASVTQITLLDGPLRPSARVRIAQPRLPVLDWVVEEMQPGVGWVWVAKSPGAVTRAHHTVRSQGAGCVAEMRLVQEGIFGAFVGWCLQGMSRRYLALEAEGLKARSEGQR